MIKIVDLVVHGPLTVTATINVLYDKIATFAYNLPIPACSDPHNINAAKVLITIQAQRIHTNINHIILHKYHTPKLKEYIIERTGRNNQIF